jgi:tetratricopeptide (TPR) repeat protein
MKNLLRLLVLTLAVAIPAFAQDAQDAKALAYTKFYEVVTQADKQADAYKLGKDYVSKYANETDDGTKYIKTFVETYEKNLAVGQRATRIATVISNVSVADPKKANYAEGFSLGKQVLQTEPDNLNVLINLGYAGYAANAAKNTAFNADAINYSRKAISLLESGKQPEDLYPAEQSINEFYPFANRDEALSYLYYGLGDLSLKSQPADAVRYYVKAAQFNTPVKSAPLTYARLADALVATSQYETKVQAFQRDFAGKPETPESKAAQAELFAVVDPIMEAHARVIAVSGAKPEFQKLKDNSTQIVTSLYKFRNNDSADGLPAYLSSIGAKPLTEPDITAITKPLTTPSPASSGTPATSTPATPTATATPVTSPSKPTTAPPIAAAKPAARTTTAMTPAASTPAIKPKVVATVKPAKGTAAPKRRP